MAEEVTFFLSKITRNSLAERCDNRGDNYKESIKRFDGLRKAAKLLNSSRSELNKRIKNKKMALIVSISALAISFIGVTIALLK